MAIHLTTPPITDEEKAEVNVLIAKHLKMRGKPDFFNDASKALIFVEDWARKMYTDGKEGNYITIRDTRHKLKGYRYWWTTWRVSLYYQVDWVTEPHWYTSKHTELATAITNAVLESYINSRVVRMSTQGLEQ